MPAAPGQDRVADLLGRACSHWSRCASRGGKTPPHAPAVIELRLRNCQRAAGRASERDRGSRRRRGGGARPRTAAMSARMARCRQPVVNRGADAAPLDRRLAGPVMAGDQQHHAFAARDRLLKAAIDGRPRRVEIHPVQIEHAIRLDRSARAVFLSQLPSSVRSCDRHRLRRGGVLVLELGGAARAALGTTSVCAFQRLSERPFARQRPDGRRRPAPTAPPLQG